MGTCLCKSIASSNIQSDMNYLKNACFYRAARAFTDEMSPSKHLRTCSFIFPIWQSFVWNYFRMRTVHWTGIHIQCSMPAVFNVRVATPRGSVPLTVRKCAVPIDHLCSEISFLRTSKSPDLISYIYRIASVSLETLYCLCAYMVGKLHKH